MRFVCAFAWADLEIQQAEREFVSKLIKALELEDDRAKILRWLESPPPAEEVDPTLVPRNHRALVLDAARHVFEADGVIHPNERAQFDLLEQLLC